MTQVTILWRTKKKKSAKYPKDYVVVVVSITCAGDVEEIDIARDNLSEKRRGGSPERRGSFFLASPLLLHNQTVLSPSFSLSTTVSIHVSVRAQARK